MDHTIIISNGIIEDIIDWRKNNHMVSFFGKRSNSRGDCRNHPSGEKKFIFFNR